MNKQLIKFFGMAALAMISLLSFEACTKDDISSSTTLDALADQSLFALEQRGNLGRHGCYDLVFPVTIKLADGTTITVVSQDSLKKALHKWHENHKDGHKKNHPEFVFPIHVIAEDGSVIAVETKEELYDLRKACKKSHLDSLHHRDSMGHKGFPKHDTLCFSLVFPIKLKKADGTIITINSKEELKTQCQGERKKGQGHGKKHGIEHQLQLVFPIQVKKSNGTTVTINTKDELKALREGC